MKHPTPAEFYETMVDKEESFDICFPGRDEDERLWPSAVRAEFENQMKHGHYPKGTTLDDIIDATEYSVQVAYRVDHQLVIYETKHEDGTSTYRLAVEEMEE